jgi:hypothetical protein
MELRYGFISGDDHVVEHPEVWTQRLAKTQWGDRIPHLEQQADGTQCWIIDGRQLPLMGTASVGATMADRTQEPQRWEEVRVAGTGPERRLWHAMLYDAKRDRLVVYGGGDERAFASLAKEYEALKALDHPNIVRIYDAGTDEGAPYLVMDFVDGRSLERIIKDEGVGVRRAAQVARTLALALQQAGVRILGTSPDSIDLAEDLADDPRGQLSTWRVVGRAEPIEVLYYAGTWNNPGRGGVDEGSGARWTDAASPRDALVRYLTGRIL